MKNVIQSTIAILLIAVANGMSAQWTQVGDDILGENENGSAGYSVSIDADGDVIAVGDRDALFNGIDGVGQARVYMLEEGAWMPKGQPIDGISEYSWCGHNVALDDTGDILAVSSINTYNEEENSVGSVGVYEFDGTSWVQMGSMIEGDDNPLGFVTFYGYGIDLSADGTTLIIGGPEKWSVDETMAGPGYAKVFDFDGSDWNQRGEDLFGEAEQMSYGKEVKVSADGQVIAVGAPRLGELFEEVGAVRIYEWMDDSWVQMGGDILGELEGDDMGEGVSLANNGTTIAVGAPGYVIGSENMIGEAKVFDFDGSDWVQRGETLESIAEVDSFGSEVSLSEDGLRLVVSASNFSDNEVTLLSNCGAAVIYEWDGAVWNDINDPILGGQHGEYARAVSMSSDGYSFGFGSFAFDPSGRARVYRDPLAPSVGESSIYNFSIYPNPVNDVVFLNCTSEMIGEEVIVFNSFGQQVHSEVVRGEQTRISLEGFANGMYVVRFKNDQSSAVRMIKL